MKRVGTSNHKLRGSILGVTVLFYTMIGSLYFYTQEQLVVRITELKQIQTAYLQVFKEDSGD